MVGPGNLFAFFVVAIWLPISLVFFMRMPPARAVLYSMLGGMLLLPLRTAFDFPLLLALDKEIVPNLAVLVGVAIFARRRLNGVRVGLGPEILLLGGVAGLFGTLATNRDVLVYGPRMLPALSQHDAISESVNLLVHAWLPFVVGRAMFRTSRELRMLFLVIAGAGLLYSAFVLYEIRMSPQLHRMFYGFFQHSFHQTVRGDNFRPMVFMAHGLPLSFFVMTTAVAATTLYRLRQRVGPVPGANAAAFLSLLLLLCRSVASILYGMVVLPLVAYARPRLQVTVAVGLAVLVLAYPALRTSGLFPTQAIVEITDQFSESRAISLQYRFDNEDDVLEKIRERVTFGWGGYSRFHIFDERGIHRTTTDGYWIIALGAYGIVGFATQFGLLTFPVFMAWSRLNRIRSRRDRQLVASLALIVAMYAIDLLPNGFFMSFYVMLCGALAGVVPGIISEQRRNAMIARRKRELDGSPNWPGDPPGSARPPSPAPRDERPASLSAILKKPGR